MNELVSTKICTREYMALTHRRCLRGDSDWQTQYNSHERNKSNRVDISDPA